MSDQGGNETPERRLRPVLPETSGQLVAYDPLQARNEDQDTIDLREYWRILTKRKWVVLSVLAIVLSASVLSTILMIPVYRSTATVQITPPNSQILEYGNFSSEGQGYLAQQQFYTTQYEILRSRDLAEALCEMKASRNIPS